VEVDNKIDHKKLKFQTNHTKVASHFFQIGCQWTIENCYPCGDLNGRSNVDLDYSEAILRMIEQERLPSGPMEQRWSASSSSPMSPAYSQNKDEIFSWVGIIQFIPVEELRDPIEKSFVGFAKKFIDIGYDFGALIHWGKVDLAFHDTPELLNEMRRALWDRCDVERYQKARALLDPKNIMSNELMTALFPHPKDESIAPPNTKSRRIVRHYTLFFQILL
jgi:L-galactono-1,4-lactone dehydrogenase